MERAVASAQSLGAWLAALRWGSRPMVWRALEGGKQAGQARASTLVRVDPRVECDAGCGRSEAKSMRGCGFHRGCTLLDHAA